MKQGGREDGKKTQGEYRGRKQRGRVVVKAPKKKKTGQTGVEGEEL